MNQDKQISIRRVLSVVIGWIHCALVVSPIFALLMNYTNLEVPRETVIQNHLRGLMIIVPIIISWFARKYLRNILLYLLVSIATVALTVWLFDMVIMAAPAALICFLRLYNRISDENRSVLDYPGYPALLIFLIPIVYTFFVREINSVYQPLAFLYMAIYFLLCFAHHGLERIDNYITVNKDMRNMPARRIVRISSALLAVVFVIFAVILLPPLLSSDIEFRYTPPEISESSSVSATPEPETEEEFTQQENMLPDLSDVKTNPVLAFLVKVIGYALVAVTCIGLVFGIIIGSLRLSRAFKRSFHDRGDFVENLQDDELEAIREKTVKEKAPGILDRSPNAVVRRRYRKTILRAAKERPQAWMTPTEAEIHAKLTGDGIARLHTVYEKARYSPEGCTRQDVSDL